MGVGQRELKGRRSVWIVQRVKTGDRCLTTPVKSERTARFVSQYYSNQQRTKSKVRLRSRVDCSNLLIMFVLHRCIGVDLSLRLLLLLLLHFMRRHDPPPPS